VRQWSGFARSASLALLFLLLVPCAALAASNDPCPRPAQGSVVVAPPDLYSQNGVLSVALNYYTTVDQWGRTLFCYSTPDGLEAPTLHVNPGDTLEVRLTNDELTTTGSGAAARENELALQSLGSGGETVSAAKDACGATIMSVLSVNIHFHGMNVSPKCHGDEVIRTLVNPNQSFSYKIRVPDDEPPGMYWYHAHVHGISNAAVEGGASGAIEVEGIANLQPAVQGLPQRFLVIRDQPLAYPPSGPLLKQAPYWDVSLNYVPVSYPGYVPGIIQMQPGAREFWRVVNAAADTVMDLQLLYDGKAQPLQIVALDGVPTGSQDGTQQGTIITQHDILIPPAGRAEFIVTGPSASVKNAVFWTNHIDTGPAGDVDTARPLAKIQLTNDLRKIPKALLATGAPAHAQRFAGVTDDMVTAHRTLYFDEKIAQTIKNPSGGMIFTITVKGQPEIPYTPYEPPAITTYRGAVEDWTIQNHTQEVHEFHIHQIHFQLLAVNGIPVPPERRQWYDTYQVPYYTGTGPWPSIKVRMDFRGAVAGEFVYHCHILDHEDAGMMANILVEPLAPPRGARRELPTHQASLTRKGPGRAGAPTHV
jgi:FtsP/CotA-like multicopper oxidase with cupredoxin domain